MGAGQMVAADYTMSPSIQFSQNTGGMRRRAGRLVAQPGRAGRSGRRHQDQRGVDHADHDRQPLGRAVGRRRGHGEEHRLRTLRLGLRLGRRRRAPAATAARPRARSSSLPSPTATTNWSRWCATTVHRPSRAAWAPAARSACRVGRRRLRPGKACPSMSGWRWRQDNPGPRPAVSQPLMLDLDLRNCARRAGDGPAILKKSLHAQDAPAVKGVFPCV